ncbi:MAG: PKD domain-containing protein, partial [Thermoplasmata archaeon]|nr:PKD domain-containing protein [Thermoplasmata archaeon]
MKGHRSLLVISLTIIVLGAAGCFDDDEENHPPAAKAGPDQTVSLVDNRAEVHFSAASSSDEDGDELSYVWDFDASDGDNDVDSTEEAPTHYYYSTGTYTVTLWVSDGKVSSRDSMIVTVVRPPGNVKARISTDDNLNDVVHEGEKKTIHFDGSESSTKEGALTDYDWDYNYTADGFDVDESGEEVEPEFESGKYLVALRVTNDTGETDIDTMTVKMNYNMTYNDELENKESHDYPLPLNTEDAYYLRVYLVSDNSENDQRDLDIYLYYPNGTEANNTSDVDQGREEIRYDRNGEYRDRLKVLGEWTVKIKHEGYISCE